MIKKLKRIGWALVAIFWLSLVGIWFVLTLVLEKKFGPEPKGWQICR